MVFAFVFININLVNANGKYVYDGRIFNSMQEVINWSNIIYSKDAKPEAGPGISGVDNSKKTESSPNKANSNAIKKEELVIPIIDNVDNDKTTEINETAANNTIENENEDKAKARTEEEEVFIHDGMKFVKGKALGKFSLSGYCACKKCSSGTGLTYSGKPVRANHTIAADKKVLPIGTYIIIENSTKNELKDYDGVYQVEDIGGGVKNNHLDIYEPTHELACLVTHAGRAYGEVYLAVLYEDEND